MAVVLVEGQEQLPGLVGASINGTQPSGVSSIATSDSAVHIVRKYGAYAVAAALAVLFILN
jgi:hypothetical protein